MKLCILFTVELQWLELWWLINHGWLELLLWSLHVILCIIHPGWLELPLARTAFHGPKPVQTSLAVILYREGISKVLIRLCLFYLHATKNWFTQDKLWLVVTIFFSVNHYPTLWIYKASNIHFLLSYLHYSIANCALIYLVFQNNVNSSFDKDLVLCTFFHRSARTYRRECNLPDRFPLGRSFNFWHNGKLIMLHKIFFS